MSSLLAGCPISQSAAVYLGAVTELVSEEIINAAGKAARCDNQSEVISPRQILEKSMAIALKRIFVLSKCSAPSS